MEAPVSTLYPFGESGPQLDGRMVINGTTSPIRDMSTWSECLGLGGSTSGFSEMAASLLCAPRGWLTLAKLILGHFYKWGLEAARHPGTPSTREGAEWNYSQNGISCCASPLWLQNNMYLTWKRDVGLWRAALFPVLMSYPLPLSPEALTARYWSTPRMCPNTSWAWFQSCRLYSHTF